MFNRIIALSVGLFFLVTQYPVTFGQDLTTTSFTIGPTEEFDPGELSGIEILDKREESVKHFCMEDGYMCAVVYPDAVHYKDGNEFKEIDNTLVENDKNEFVNTDSPMKVKFPKTLNNENPVSINVEGKQITWYYISGKETKSEGVVHNSKERTNDQTEVNQIISRAEYKNVDDNIDLDYMINSFEVKEKIVINKKTEKEIFKFNFQTNGLKARINTENEIEFIDEGSEPSNPRIIYKIGRGLMYDNSGNFSDAIKYEVSKAESGYIISIIPDKEWMESQERSYPIVIDPPINSQPSHKDIEDAYTNSYYSKNPKKNRRNKSFWGSWFLPVGRAKHDQIFETYLKFKGLPQLSKGEMIVKSYLCLCVPKDRNDACYRSILNKINVKKVIDPWNQKTISWDNAPKVDKSVTDYTNIDETGKWYKWDITRMTRDWYKLPNVNENNGVQLSSQILCEDKYVRFVGTDISTKPEFNAIRPKVMIHYRNFNGIKPHWSYSKHSVGTCGTGAVNNYSGNLTITEDVFSNSGLRIPLNISNTYNSVNSNEQANSYIITCEHIRSKDHKINPDGHSRSSKSGFGWYLSFNAMLQPISSSDFLYKQGYRYVYIDSDATVHYFKLDGGEIVDEDGLGLKLSTIDKGPKSSGLGESVKITDKSDNVIIFKDNVLNQIIDNEGNITNFICKEQPNTGGRKKDLQITDIIEPNGRKTTINYNSDGFVSSILHPDGKSTTFEYSKGLLKKINYPDGLKTGYTYDSKNRLISGYTTKGSGNSIFYEYVSDSENSPEFNKIKKIEEYGDTYQSPTKLGNSINFEYRNDNTTKVKYENNNSEVTYGKGTEIWQFDNAGRATSILNEDGSISTVEYTKTKRGTDKSKNKILHTGNANKYVSNLLKNSSASDDMKHWKIENWKDNHSSSKNGTWFVDIETNPNYANLGEKSFKVSQSSPTHSLVSQQIEVPVLTQDKKYTFSADVKVDGELKGNGGALLQFYSWGGSIGFKNLTFGENLKSTDNEWRRISLTVTAPKGSSSLIFYFGLKDVTGIAWFDRVQVEEGEVPNDYNMIENSNFSCGMENWSGTNLEGKDGIFNRAMKLYGTSWNKKNVFQKISVNKTNPTFSVAASATANSVPFSSNKRFCIALLISYKDGGERWVDVEFNPAVTGSKQYASKNIPSVDYSPNFNQSKVVSSITLYLCYDYNQNSVEFHDVQVSIDEGGNSFAYDSRGNVIGLQDSAKNGINTERDVKSNEINRIVSPKGYKTDNIYDNKKIHRLIKSVSDILFGRTKTEFKHDEFGNVLKTTVSSDSNNGKIIESSATYSNQGNYSESITDSRGKTFYTFYDDQNGNLKQTMSAKNVKTDYEYDSVGRILSSKIGDTGNNYDYDNGLLSKITHKIDDLKKVTYSFIRNFFGQVTKVKVGNSTLVENIYDQGNGLPRRILYGNGHDIKYEYDKFGRIIKKSCSNGDYSYVYNNKSELYSAFDASNNIKTVFEYDLAGRVIVRRRSDGTTLTCSYDKHNLIENQKFQIEGVKQKLYNKFGPSDCLEYSEFDTNGIKCKHEYGYDNLGRNTEQTVNSENNNICQNIFKHCYNYLDLRESKTTFLVKDITYAQYINGSWKNINDKRYSYEYDEVGNITKITDHNGKETSYCYDDLNQLVRENNPYLGKTITYKYDLGGNILCKKFYEYKVEKPTVLLSTVNYSYDDENWKDKLTEYNDEKITYDEIGNPLKYRDSWNFTWQNGRQLTSGTKNNENITYKYNDLGIRVEKVVGGKVKKYEVLGNQILAEKTDDGTICWQIDGNGEVVGFTYKNNQYFYVKNAQGDIVGITDKFGKVIVDYEYNSWGKLISIKDVSENNIGEVNPLRYRSYYYDTETDLYYLNSRFYDPETGRFINADAYISTDQGINDKNMYIYCGNNPVSRKDQDGMFWKEIGNFFGAVGKAVINCVKAVFGSETTIVHQNQKHEKFFVPDPWPITIKTGIKENTVLNKRGSSSKPILVYAKKRADNITLSSVGMKVKMKKFTLNTSLGIDDIAISGSLKLMEATHSFGINSDLTQLKLGFEYSSTYTTIKWDSNLTENTTSYINVSASGWSVVAAYIYLTHGHWVPSPQKN